MEGHVPFVSGEFKMILMNTTFSFNPDTHAGYSDVSGEELVLSGEGPDTGYQGPVALTSGELTEDDTNNRGRATWADVQFDAIGDDMDPTGGAVLYSGEVVVAGIDFGEDYTVNDGSSLIMQAVAVNLW